MEGKHFAHRSVTEPTRVEFRQDSRRRDLRRLGERRIERIVPGRREAERRTAGDRRTTPFVMVW